MKKGKRYQVSLTEQEIKLLIEAAGAYKPRVKGFYVRMRNKYGIDDKGRSTSRLAAIRSAQFKLTGAYGVPVDMPLGMYPRHKGRRKKEQK